MKLLIISDLHMIIPEIPEIIKEYGEKCDYIICAGDYTSERTLNAVKKLNENNICVKGNCDSLELPEYIETKLLNYKIGVIHSSQFGRGNMEGLYKFAKLKNLDVIIFGHTHKPLIKKIGNILLINPGTLSGAIRNSYRYFSICRILRNLYGFAKKEKNKC
ncbi:MAG: YfcE family phosphodiesterase [Candidatus Aenigmarchaeota archaeon ex4484_56]|nr:MAG: YfcE family phosphodiesterase [Candidatus Aenigmarchaeota archaeon ex4484_56]